MRIAILLSLLILSAACHKRKPRPESKGKPEVVSEDSVKKSLFPAPMGVVSDFENILSISEEKELRDSIDAFRARTGNQIAIVTIDSIQPYSDFALYANDLANEWGIGDSIENNGLLIAMSRRLRTIRIATGIGTEKKLSDRFCSRVMQSQILPEFKGGNYFTGLKKGLSALTKEWEK